MKIYIYDDVTSGPSVTLRLVNADDVAVQHGGVTLRIAPKGIIELRPYADPCLGLHLDCKGYTYTEEA